VKLQCSGESKVTLSNDAKGIITSNLSSKSCRSNVELNSKSLCAVLGPMSSSHRALFYVALCSLTLSSCYTVAAFEIRIQEIIGKINLDHYIGIRKNNLNLRLLNSRRHKICKTGFAVMQNSQESSCVLCQHVLISRLKDGSGQRARTEMS